MKEQFKVGERVKDRDGHCGTIESITHYEDSHWYTVRFRDGNRIVGAAVRYENDLLLDNEARNQT